MVVLAKGGCFTPCKKGGEIVQEELFGEIYPGGGMSRGKMSGSRMYSGTDAISHPSLVAPNGLAVKS